MKIHLSPTITLPLTPPSPDENVARSFCREMVWRAVLRPSTTATAGAGATRSRSSPRPAPRPGRRRRRRRRGDEAVDRPAVGPRALKVGDQRTGEEEPEETDDEAADHHDQHAVHQHTRAQRRRAHLTTTAHWAVNREKQESLALAIMARDDPPASSTAAAMRGKVGSEFET